MFQVGDKIVHPMHGAGVIDSITTRRINGVDREYYVLKLSAGGMLVMVPIDHCEEVGVRPVMTQAEVDKILQALPEIEVEADSNWNRRYRENMVRLKSGDLIEVARVMKCLLQRDEVKGLSTGERKMLSSARQILVSEIVMAEDSEYEEVERRVDLALTQ